ncbi:putative translation initiation inhibitor [Klebsiella pneumoniae subsp. pneumoniae]|uniref:Putative translation initiation inhibitor n=1 Tax=Klebsiella pneumoniae subsp. pneumoniae TaxID=72407 RepID=A0A377ZGC6_KLEPN|nr:putative translation initiation inhibitor [Klebsiella pneumoniae subsp. pneumoniae]
METNRMTIIRNNPQPRLSASVAYGDLLFLSGQTPKSNEDDIVLQTREVLEKIDALLAAAGSDKQHILSAQIWLKNIERDFAAFNEVWVQWMPEGYSRRERPCRRRWRDQKSWWRSCSPPSKRKD